MRFPVLSVVLFVFASASCATPGGVTNDDAGVNQVLDAWHAAASRADEAAYFGALAPEAVFLGTDASERWTVEEFRAYAHPHFAAGRGWTYVPRDRHIAYDADGRSAWIDEKLENEKYGELRGTGVLVRGDAGWRIAHYSMSFPIPNELTLEVVEKIRAGTPSAAPKDSGR
jgi:hypothetical protein